MTAAHVPAVSRRDVHLHPTAVVDAPETLGAGTHVWHFSHVMSGAVVAELFSWLDAKLRITPNKSPRKSTRFFIHFRRPDNTASIASCSKSSGS